MAQKLTDTIVRALPAPPKGNRVFYDETCKGFGCRVTAKGTLAFILNYRTRAGRERRYTIGAFPDWKTGSARSEACQLKRRIDRGDDPMAEIEADRNAPTVADLCQRFEAEHLPKIRPSTARDYRSQIRLEILPSLKHRKVTEVVSADIDGLHRKITKRGAPYQANRVIALLSKMFSMAIRWKWLTDNPCLGIERNQEDPRHRYLSADELARLSRALAEAEDQQAANIVRLLLLTGARRGEVRSATWDQFDLTAGIWTKPPASTKQKKMHRVPLSAPARELLVDMSAKSDSEYVFPGSFDGHRGTIHTAWHSLCIAAGLVVTETVTDAKGRKRVVVKPSVRVHDLRHTFASILASAGQSLPIIGALLGHTQPATTARYAHLLDDPLRAATETVGAILTAQDRPEGEVVPMVADRPVNGL